MGGGTGAVRQAPKEGNEGGLSQGARAGGTHCRKKSLHSGYCEVLIRGTCSRILPPISACPRVRGPSRPALAPPGPRCPGRAASPA